MTRRSLAKLLVGTFVVLQAGQLLTGPIGRGTFWPLCAYDMFALRTSPPFETVRVVLIDDRGVRTHAHPGNVLPLEFFRSVVLISRTYREPAPEPTRQRLAEAILRGLRERPWSGFDEVWPAVRPEPGHEFVAVAFYLHEQALVEGASGAELEPRGEKLLYEWRPGRRA